MKYGTLTKAIYSYYTININGDPVIFYSTLLIFIALIISFAQRGSELSSSIAIFFPSGISLNWGADV